MVSRSFLHPQEIEVFYILPTLRRHMVFFMKKNGMKQTDIAKLLHIKDGAVSQYLSGKRGVQITFSQDILKEIEKAVEHIHDTPSLLIQTQSLLHFIRQTGMLCHAHKQFSEVPSVCNPEVVGCSEGGFFHDIKKH